MSRLIAFGDSFTHGCCLEDQPYPNTFEHHFQLPVSSLSYPQLVGEQLGLETVNLAQCGVSNKYILRRMLEFKYQPGDRVMIMWTDPMRSSIYTKRGERHDVAIDPHNTRTYFYRVHNDFDLIYSDCINRFAADAYCKSLNIDLMHLSIGDYQDQTPEWFNIHPAFIFSNYLDDYAVDGAHFNEASHRQLADAIVSKLRQDQAIDSN